MIARIVYAAIIRAQPHFAPPQPEQRVRGKGGQTPGESNILAFITARCWGEARGVLNGDTTMPQQKDFKRVVRARMQKTGESYTAARAQLLRKPKTKTTRLARALNAPSVADYAKLAGMSDAVVKAKTGCNWERWVKALDKLGADRLSHREVATLVNQKFEVGPWWGQMLTVGY